jgi:predicted anti-sigma-YlaC factor YlaD
MSDSIDCRAVTRLISLGLDRELPPAEREQVQLHFLACRSCRSTQEQLDFLRRAMRQLGPAEAEPPER